MKRDAIDLGNVHIPTLFRIYLVPTLLGMLALCAVTATDGIFVGRGCGSDALAAVNICISPTMVMMGIGLMLGVGASVVSSLHLAAGNIKAARLNITQALLVATVLAGLFLIATLSSPRHTALLLGSSESLMPLVLDYMPWIFATCVFQIWCAIGLFIVRLDGSPKYAMWSNVLPGLLNVILDYLFIFPDLRPAKLKISLTSLRLTFRNIGYQCKIGISALLGEATMGVLMLMGNLGFMRYIGNDGVGAFSIACYYFPFAFMIGNAIAQSAQPIISYNYGLGERSRVVSTEKLAIITALICGGAVTASFSLLPELMVGLFLDTHSEAALIAIAGFPVYSTAFVFFIFNLTAIGYFQSIEKALPAIIFALLRGVIFLVPSFILVPKLLGINAYGLLSLFPRS